MVCSTGYASPQSGVYGTAKINTWHELFGNVYGQYCTQIVGNILFHSVPYLEKGNNSSLEYWEYDKLGTTASAGCIRLRVNDAKWIYNNCNNGTLVEFYRSSNPGPLGKPSSTKISSEESPYKNWDPVDPNPNNPWKNKPATKKEEPKNNTVQNNVSKNDIQNNNTNSSNNTQNSNTSKNNTLNSNTINNTQNSNASKNNTSNNNTINNTQSNNTSKNNVTNNTSKNNTNSSNITQNNTTSKNNTIKNNTIKNNTAKK